MPLPRPVRALQNISQFCRFVLAWMFALGVGLVFVMLSAAVNPARLWYRLRLPWARLTLKLLRINVQVTHQEHLAVPAVIVANHMSLIDVVVLPALVPRGCRFVAKRELLFVPFWGWAFASGGALLIDRRNPRLAAKSLTLGLSKLPPGWSVVVFPEGTRSRTGELQRFKSGAFTMAIAGKLPIVPVGLAGTSKIIGNKQWFVRSGTVHVHVGQPIDTQTWTQATVRDHMQQAQVAVGVCVAQAGEALHAAEVAVAHGGGIQSRP